VEQSSDADSYFLRCQPRVKIRGKFQIVPERTWGPAPILQIIARTCLYLDAEGGEVVYGNKQMTFS